MARREISEEERERRRQVARRLVAEGRFGGPQPGSGRPRKPRASELIAIEVAKEAELLRDQLLELAQSPKSDVRLKAIQELLKIEERERAIEVESELQIAKMRRDELAERAMALLEKAVAKNLVTIPEEPAIDAEGEEVSDHVLELSA